MAAHEEEDQGVVPFHSVDVVGRQNDLLVDRCRDDGCRFPSSPRGLAAHEIRHAPGGNLDQPAARVVGHAFARPLHTCGEEGFLDRVFRGREVLETAYDRAEHLRRQLAEQVLARGVQEYRRHAYLE